MDLDEAWNELAAAAVNESRTGTYLSGAILAVLAHRDAAEVQRQIEYRDGRTWRRTLHIHATEWTPDNEKGVTS